MNIIAISDIIVVPSSPLCLQVQWLSLHIAGPAQCPRVDKPHPASVPRPLPAVTGRSLEMIAQAVRNCSCVTDRNYGQFSQDTIDWDDVKNWFLVVQLVQDPGTDRIKPVCNASNTLISFTCIMIIIDIIDIITIIRIVVCFQC